jgi:hypothetical protein
VRKRERRVVIVSNRPLFFNTTARCRPPVPSPLIPTTREEGKDPASALPSTNTAGINPSQCYDLLLLSQIDSLLHPPSHARCFIPYRPSLAFASNATPRCPEAASVSWHTSNSSPISFRGSARALHLNSTHLEDTSELDGGFTGTFLLKHQHPVLFFGRVVSAHHFGL